MLLSTDGGATWSDLTLDKNNDGWLHPDQHALVTIPSIRCSADRSATTAVSCARTASSRTSRASATSVGSTRRHGALQVAALADARPDDRAEQGPVDAAVPEPVARSEPSGRLHGRDAGQRHVRVQRAATNEWPQIIYGDGGQSGWNAADSKLRFNTFTGQANDVNFRNGDPTNWVIASGPILSSPDGVATSIRRSSPTRTRRRRARSSRARSASGGRRTGAATRRSRGELPRVHDRRPRTPPAVTSSAIGRCRGTTGLDRSARRTAQTGRAATSLLSSGRRAIPTRSGLRREPAGCSSATTPTRRIRRR